jgi:hypothetical protein
MSDNPQRRLGWELLTAIGVTIGQIVGVSVWLGIEHAEQTALTDRVNRNEQTVSARLTRIEDDQRAALRDLATAMEKVSAKLEDLRVLVAARLGK